MSQGTVILFWCVKWEDNLILDEGRAILDTVRVDLKPILIVVVVIVVVTGIMITEVLHHFMTEPTKNQFSLLQINPCFANCDTDQCSLLIAYSPLLSD